MYKQGYKNHQLEGVKADVIKIVSLSGLSCYKFPDAPRVAFYLVISLNILIPIPIPNPTPHQLRQVIIISQESFSFH